jgi:hypothetical protein
MRPGRSQIMLARHGGRDRIERMLSIDPPNWNASKADSTKLKPGWPIEGHSFLHDFDVRGPAARVPDILTSGFR